MVDCINISNILPNIDIHEFHKNNVRIMDNG